MNLFIPLFTAYKDQEFLNSKDGYRKQMITYKEQQPDWDSTLILHKGVRGHDLLTLLVQ